MRYTVTVHDNGSDIVGPVASASELRDMQQPIPIEIYRQSFEALDLPRFIAALNKPVRKRRADAGKKKGEA